MGGINKRMIEVLIIFAFVIVFVLYAYFLCMYVKDGEE